VGQHTQITDDLLWAAMFLADAEQGAELGLHLFHCGRLVVGHAPGALEKSLRMGPQKGSHAPRQQADGLGGLGLMNPRRPRPQGSGGQQQCQRRKGQSTHQ